MSASQDAARSHAHSVHSEAKAEAVEESTEGRGRGPSDGALRVWHVPQIPGDPFIVHVRSVEEGARLLGTLADYDRFQLKHNIKPDYCSANGLEVARGGEWESWDEDGEDDPLAWLEAHGALTSESA